MAEYGKSRVAMSVVESYFSFTALLAVRSYREEVWKSWVVMPMAIIVKLGEVASQPFVCLMGFIFQQKGNPAHG